MIRPTRLGRYQVPEDFGAIARMHIHENEALSTVDWEPKIAVLDQEDLHTQGIRSLCWYQGPQT